MFHTPRLFLPLMDLFSFTQTIKESTRTILEFKENRNNNLLIKEKKNLSRSFNVFFFLLRIVKNALRNSLKT